MAKMHTVVAQESFFMGKRVQVTMDVCMLRMYTCMYIATRHINLHNTYMYRLLKNTRNFSQT